MQDLLPHIPYLYTSPSHSLPTRPRDENIGNSNINKCANGVGCTCGTPNACGSGCVACPTGRGQVITSREEKRAAFLKLHTHTTRTRTLHAQIHIHTYIYMHKRTSTTLTHTHTHSFFTHTNTHRQDQRWKRIRHFAVRILHRRTVSKCWLPKLPSWQVSRADRPNNGQ